MAKYASILYLSVLVLCCISCNNSKTSKETNQCDKKFENKMSLFAVDSIMVNQVFDMATWNVNDNGLAVVNNEFSDSIVSLFSLLDGELIKKRYMFGNGPEEFVVINPGSAKDSNSILVYDMMKRKMSLVDTNNKSLKINVEYSLPVDGDGLAQPYTYINQFNDSLFLMKLDTPDESSWQMADLKNSKILWSEKNIIRDAKYSYTPYDFIQSISDSTLLIAYKYIDLIEFYNISENGVRHLISYGNPVAQSELKDYELLTSNYLSVASDRRYYYCLLSNNGDEWGNQIEVYDVSSHKPIYVYSLDKNVYSIRYHNNRLIGYSPEDDKSTFYVWSVK